jgi:hypothetical protein
MGKINTTSFFPPSVIALLLFGFLSVGTAGEIREEKFDKDEYTFEITRKEITAYSDIPKTRVTCGGERKQADLKDTDVETFSMSISETVQTELSAVFSVGANIKFVEGKLELRNKILNETKNMNKELHELEVLRAFSIKPLKCFNQTAMYKAYIARYRVRLIKVEKSWFGEPKKIYNDLDWEEPLGHEFLITANYDESCHDECVINMKYKPVKGKDGKQINAHLFYKNETIYVLPLYWNDKGELINLLQFLPEDDIDFGAIQ